MTDRSLIIIFCVLNLLMWFIVVDYVIRTKRMDAELLKRIAETQKKNVDYFHFTHENIVEMTRLNLNAMNSFIEQISDKMNIGDKDEKEDRK